MGKQRTDLDNMESDSMHDMGFDDNIFGSPTQGTKKQQAGAYLTSGAIDMGRGAIGSMLDDKWETASDIARKALPYSVSSEVDSVDNMVKGVKKAFEENIEGLKHETGSLAKVIAGWMPQNSKLEKLFLSLDKKLSKEAETRETENKQAEQDREIQEGILSALGELTEKSHVDSLAQQAMQSKASATTNVLLQNIYAETHLLRHFTYDVTNKYFRKSLEIQYRSLFIQRELLEFTKYSAQAVNQQLETIVRNTALPDILKTRSAEFFKAEMAGKMRSTMIDTFYKQFNPLQDFSKNLSNRVTRMLKDFTQGIAGAKEGLLAMNMFKDMDQNGEMAMMGMNKAYMIGSMFTDTIKGVAADRLRPLLEKMPGLGRASYKLKNWTSDPRSFFANMQDRFTGNGFISRQLRKAAGIGVSLAGGPGSKRAEYGRYDLDEVRPFDGRSHQALVKIIPGYLSRILAELTFIRKNTVKGSKDSEVEAARLTFDTHNDTFKTLATLKKDLDTRMKNQIEGGVKNSLNNIRNIFDRAGVKLSKNDVLALNRALVKHMIRYGSSVHAETLFDPGFLEKIETPKTAKLLLKNAEKMREAMYKDPYLTDDLQRSLSELRSNIPDFAKVRENIYKSGETQFIKDQKWATEDNAGNLQDNTDTYRDYILNMFEKSSNIKGVSANFDYNKEVHKLAQNNNSIFTAGNSLSKSINNKINAGINAVASYTGINLSTDNVIDTFINGKDKAKETLQRYFNIDTKQMGTNYNNLVSFGGDYFKALKDRFDQAKTPEEREAAKKAMEEAASKFSSTLNDAAKGVWNSVNVDEMKKDYQSVKTYTKEKAQDLWKASKQQATSIGNSAFNMLPKAVQNDLKHFKNWAGNKWENSEWVKEGKKLYARIKDLTLEQVTDFFISKAGKVQAFMLNLLPGQTREYVQKKLVAMRGKITGAINGAKNIIAKITDPKRREEAWNTIKEYKKKTGQILKDIGEEGFVDGLFIKHEEELKALKAKLNSFRPQWAGGTPTQTWTLGGYKNNWIQRQFISVKTRGKGYNIGPIFPQHLRAQMQDRGIAKERIDATAMVYEENYRVAGEDKAYEALLIGIDNLNKELQKENKPPVELDERKVRHVNVQNKEMGWAAKQLGGIYGTVSKELGEFREASKNPFALADYVAKKWKKPWMLWKKRPRDLAEVQKEYLNAVGQEAIDNGTAPSFDMWVAKMGYNIKDPKKKGSLIKRFFQAANRLDRAIVGGIFKRITGIGLGKGKKGLIRRVAGAPLSVGRAITKSASGGVIGDIMETMLPFGLGKVMKAPFVAMNAMAEGTALMLNKIKGVAEEKDDKNSDENRKGSYLKRLGGFFKWGNNEEKKSIKDRVKDFARNNKGLTVIGILGIIGGLMKGLGISVETMVSGVKRIWEILTTGFNFLKNALSTISSFAFGSEAGGIIGTLGAGLAAYGLLRHPFKTAGALGSLALGAGKGVFKLGKWGLDKAKGINSKKVAQAAQAASPALRQFKAATVGAGALGTGMGVMRPGMTPTFGKTPTVPVTPTQLPGTGPAVKAPAKTNVPQPTSPVAPTAPGKKPSLLRRGRGWLWGAAGVAMTGLMTGIDAIMGAWSMLNMFKGPDLPDKNKAPKSNNPDDPDNKKKTTSSSNNPDEEAKKNAAKADAKQSQAAKAAAQDPRGHLPENEKKAHKAVDELIKKMSTHNPTEPNIKAYKSVTGNGFFGGIANIGSNIGTALSNTWNRTTTGISNTAGKLGSMAGGKLASVIEGSRNAIVGALTKLEAGWNALKTQFNRIIKAIKMFGGGITEGVTKAFGGKFGSIISTIGKGVAKMGAKVATIVAGLATGPIGLIFSILGTGLLIWDIAWVIYYYMFDGRSFLGALSEQFLGVNLADPVDPETGEFVAVLDSVKESQVKQIDTGDKTVSKSDVSDYLAKHNEEYKQIQEQQKTLKKQHEEYEKSTDFTNLSREEQGKKRQEYNTKAQELANKATEIANKHTESTVKSIKEERKEKSNRLIDGGGIINPKAPHAKKAQELLEKGPSALQKQYYLGSPFIDGNAKETYEYPDKNYKVGEKIPGIKKTQIDLNKLNPEFGKRIKQFAQDMYEQTGKKLELEAGFRPYEVQKGFFKYRTATGNAVTSSDQTIGYVLPQNPNGTWSKRSEKMFNGVALPGRSKHGSGIALDIKPKVYGIAKADISYKPVLDETLKKYGLYRSELTAAREKYGQGKSGKEENWHIQPAPGTDLTKSLPSIINTPSDGEGDGHDVSESEANKDPKPEDTNKEGYKPTLEEQYGPLYASHLRSQGWTDDGPGPTTNTTSDTSMSPVEQAQAESTQQQTAAATSTAETSKDIATSTTEAASTTSQALSTLSTVSPSGGGNTAGASKDVIHTASTPASPAERMLGILTDQLATQKSILAEISSIAKHITGKTQQDNNPTGPKTLPSPVIDVSRSRNFSDAFI